MRPFLIASFALLALLALPALASAPNDADYVKARLAADGYEVKGLELELNLTHQFSHLMAPVGDLAQKMISDEIVTMKYYDLHFRTTQGYLYGCVAGIGTNEHFATQSKYVEIKNCQVSLDEQGTLVKSRVVQLGQ